MQNINIVQPHQIPQNAVRLTVLAGGDERRRKLFSHGIRSGELKCWKLEGAKTSPTYVIKEDADVYLESQGVTVEDKWRLWVETCISSLEAELAIIRKMIDNK